MQESQAIAWTAEDGVKPAGLDPSGGSAAVIQERTERAARQLARGQEQLVLLLLTAIVTYLTRGQVKAGLMNSMDSIAARSASLQAQISNKEFANWLTKNQSKFLAEPELQVKDVTPLKKPEPEPPATPQPLTKTIPAVSRVMSLHEAVGENMAERWVNEARAWAAERNPRLSALLSDDQIGALYGYSTDDVYTEFNAAMRAGNTTPGMDAFALHATEGLAKLPKYTGFETYRGTDLPQTVLDRMQTGATEADMAFFSSSATTPFAGNTQMVVGGVSGKDISS